MENSDSFRTKIEFSPIIFDNKKFQYLKYKFKHLKNKSQNTFPSYLHLTT